jgi:hemophore-related protein
LPTGHRRETERLEDMPLMTRLVAAAGGLALTFTAGMGTASAEPDITPLLDSTCTYDQVVAAMNQNEPELAGTILNNPLAVGFLHRLIAAGPDERRTMYEQAAARYPVNAPKILSLASTCQNFPA